MLEAAELGRVIDAFLRTLPEMECSIFLRRYWYLDSIDTARAVWPARRGGEDPLEPHPGKAEKIFVEGGVRAVKRIDETQLLQAMGEVGDDLLLRAGAARGQPGAARPWRGALAACLCLALVLTAVLYLPNSFRMGSSGNTAAEPGAAQNESAGHPNYEQGQPEAGQEGSDYETAVDAVPEHEGAEKGETGREHPEHGMQDGAACLAELGIGDASALAAAACGGRSVPAADLYQALASAAVMDADRDAPHCS